MKDRKAPVGLSFGLNCGDPDFAHYLRRSMARAMGYLTNLLNRPVIGIANTISEFSNCHHNVPERVNAAERGVLAAGGLLLDFRAWRHVLDHDIGLAKHPLQQRLAAQPAWP